MKMDYKKTLKLITLLLSSLLIATVSAQVYTYMYIDGSVTISTDKGLRWVQGDSAPSGTSIAGSTVTLPLAVNNGTTTNFTHVLYLQNLDASAHSVLINITTAATSSKYETNGFNLTIYTNSTTPTYIGQLDVLSTSSYYSGSIAVSEVWHITFELYTKTDASGSDSFDVQFRYE